MGLGFSNAFEIALDPADLTGQAAQREANQARDIMFQYGQMAIDEQRAAREQARADLSPFTELGTRNIAGLESLITDPNAQRDYVQNNPFFESMANEAQKRLFQNQAAKGKVGSGGTAEALQNSLLLLGNDLLQQNIGNRFNLVNAGQAAAAGQAQASIQTAAPISNILTQMGNVAAEASLARHVASTQNRAVAANFIGSLFGKGGGGGNQNATGGVNSFGSSAMSSGANIGTGYNYGSMGGASRIGANI